MASKSERKLPWLPDQGAPDLEYRDFLTLGMGCHGGARFQDFTRFGTDGGDACKFTLSMPGGEVLSFRMLQRQLANPATLRGAVAATTNGLLRPPIMSKVEYEDVWIALVTLANILDEQSDADEVWSWLAQYERVCDPLEGLSLTSKYRLDALLTLQRRPTWGRTQALAERAVEPGARPVWIVDHVTREQYLRASELLAFIRHGIGAGPISTSTLTSRFREIGGERIKYEVRSRVDRGLYPRIAFYLLPPAEPEEGGK